MWRNTEMHYGKTEGGVADGRIRQEREKEKADRKRAQLKLAMRKRLEAERTSHEAVLRLLEGYVTQEMLAQLGGKITPAHYDDVIEERALERLCGFPLCNRHLKNIAQQQFKIFTQRNKVYDITRRKRFCSNFCCGASQYFASQIPNGPLGMREGEMPPQFKFLQQGDSYEVGLCGDEVPCTWHKVMRKADIEAEDPADACCHPSSHSHSPSPSSSDEDDFVSSIVGRDRKRHFAHHSESMLEEERGQLHEQTNSHGRTLTSLEINGDNDEDTMVVSPASDLLNSDPSFIHPENTKPGSHSAATNQTGGCLDTELMLQVSQMTLAPDPEIWQPLPVDPVTKQYVPLDLDSKDLSLLDNTVTASLNAGSRDASPLAPCISSYGISASGAAALRKLLVHHRSAGGTETQESDVVRKPVRQGSIAEKVAATLRSWRTDEAVEFLHCDGTMTSLLEPSNHPDDAVRGEQKGVVRHYAAMQRVAALQKEHVTKFFKGFHHVIEEEEEGGEETEEPEEPEVPILPSSWPPSQIRMRIVGDGLHVALPSLLAPLGMSLNDVSSELGKLLRLLRFTPNNIVHKPGEWTIIAATLIQLLSSKIPILRDALSHPSRQAHLESTLQKFAISKADTDYYLSIFNPEPSKSET
uniref:putative RNA polymerase II subunit B1 CTD phosphatase RPAP2 isoform X1 n=2 Tax=Myxine glutinosa TaxID=7769 RepID=UPI00358F12C9